MATDLDHLVDLRLRSAPREPPNPSAARAFLARAYEPLLSSASTLKRLHHGDRWIGAILHTEPLSERFGIPEASVLIFCDPDAPEAQSWAESALEQLGPQLEAHCSIQLSSTDRALLGTLKRLDFGVAKVDLDGSAPIALERLRGTAMNPSERGLAICATERHQAAEITVLMRDFFLAYPNFGWGGPVPSQEAQGAIDRRERERLEQRLVSEPGNDFIVTREGKITGTFGFTHQPEHPLRGNCAGLYIVLLPEVQGIGLGRAAYLHMLQRMEGLGVQRLYGRTSNPGVIHIARSTGRRLRRLILRRDGPFIPGDLIPEH